MEDRPVPYKLKKELGLLDLFSISAGAMISTGMFILPGLAFARAGPAVIFSYLLGCILLIPVILCKAELATAMPKAGGNYFYASRAMGLRFGAFEGLAAMFSFSFKSAFALLGMGIFLLLIFPGITEMQIKLVAVVCCLFFAVVNLFGAKPAGWVQVVMVGILISLLVLYVIFGSFSVQLHRYTPLVPFGLGSVWATAAFLFVSYAGLTKICAVAEEVRNPGRDIPLALLLAFSIVTLLYLTVTFITVGLVDFAQLQGSLLAISLGADTLMGRVGALVMGVAALLSFASTGNAGILSASRSPLSMSEDELLPGLFKRISKFGVPWFSILLTAACLIAIILFLDLEDIIKVASTLKLVLYTTMCLSLIIMRESKLPHYRPTFRAPLYPWLQILGIVGYGFLISTMGVGLILSVGCAFVGGWGWHWIYARDTKRDYAFLYVVERITGKKLASGLLDDELRQILIKRDAIV